MHGYNGSNRTTTFKTPKCRIVWRKTASQNQKFNDVECRPWGKYSEFIIHKSASGRNHLSFQNSWHTSAIISTGDESFVL